MPLKRDNKNTPFGMSYNKFFFKDRYIITIGSVTEQ